MANQPSHIVLQGITTKRENPRTGKNVYYNRIGAGFPVEGKPGYISITLNSIPVDGKMLICPANSEEARDSE